MLRCALAMSQPAMRPAKPTCRFVVFPWNSGDGGFLTSPHLWSRRRVWASGVGDWPEAIVKEA